MFDADFVVKWIHVSSACLLLGSLALLMWGMLPAMSSDSSPFTDLVMRRAKTIVHSSLGLLLLTGGYNFWRVLSKPVLANNSGYQSILGVKILLFIIIYALAIIALKGIGSGMLPRARRLLPWLVLLTFIVVALSTYLNLKRIDLLVASAQGTRDAGAGLTLGSR